MKMITGVVAGGLGLILAGGILSIDPRYPTLPYALMFTGVILVGLEIYVQLANHIERLPLIH